MFFSSSGNYRPNSILNGFSKIYEKAYSNRLLLFFDKFGVIAVNQHGFKKTISINTAIFEYVQNNFLNWTIN